MKAILAIIVAALYILLCGCGEDKFVRKKISQGDITVEWFYYSYYRNYSPEFVAVSKGDSLQTIFEATSLVTDISIDDKTIIVKTHEVGRSKGRLMEPPSTVFGYDIFIDTLATYEEFRYRPKGLRE